MKKSGKKICIGITIWLTALFLQAVGGDSMNIYNNIAVAIHYS